MPFGQAGYIKFIYLIQNYYIDPGRTVIFMQDDLLIDIVEEKYRDDV